MKTKSALSWFGSDASVAAELASMLDGCTHVTIPFVGGASIIPHLKARAIVANDLNNLAINFYKVVAGIHGDRQWLFKQCSSTLSHPQELVQATAVLAAPDIWCATDLAWAYWAQVWLGRKGTGGTDRVHKTKPSIRWSANGGTNSSRLSSAADDLALWAEHFERCEFTCLDFREIAAKLKDDPKCGSYWDAPWPTAGDRYIHKFTEQDHGDMRDVVGKFEHHRIVIRYGDHPMIRDLYADNHWTITDASSRTQANKNIGEIWITNFDLKAGDAVSLEESDG
ncbi:MAG: DNA adenine methylase [Planctomycetota bacterium]